MIGKEWDAIEMSSTVYFNGLVFVICVWNQLFNQDFIVGRIHYSLLLMIMLGFRHD